MIYSQDKDDILKTVLILNKTYINSRRNFIEQLVKENQIRINSKYVKIKESLIGDDVDKFIKLAFKINIAKFEEIFVKT
jgi:hypothetical protein